LPKNAGTGFCKRAAKLRKKPLSEKEHIIRKQAESKWVNETVASLVNRKITGSKPPFYMNPEQKPIGSVKLAKT
jgi:hypothetical protein